MDVSLPEFGVEQTCIGLASERQRNAARFAGARAGGLSAPSRKARRIEPAMCGIAGILDFGRPPSLAELGRWWHSAITVVLTIRVSSSTGRSRWAWLAFRSSICLAENNRSTNEDGSVIVVSERRDLQLHRIAKLAAVARTPVLDSERYRSAGAPLRRTRHARCCLEIKRHVRICHLG